MNPTIVVMLIVLLLYSAVSLVMVRKIKNSDSFYIMEEKAPTLFLVAGMCMAYVSAVTMSSGPGVCYTQGPMVLLSSAQPGAWMGMIVAVLIIGRKMKSIGCYTMPDYFVKRFSDHNVTFLAIIIMGGGLLLYGVGQLIAIGNILSEATGISYGTLILIFTIAIMLFCVPGGIWSVMMTDVLMFVVVFLTMVVVCPVVLGQIAPEALQVLPPEFWSAGGLRQQPVSYNVSQFFLWFMFFAASPVIITRVFPAKNDFAVCKACVISVALIAVMSGLAYLTAGMMRGVESDILQADQVLLVAFQKYAPAGLGLIGLAGILTAAISTAAIVFELSGFAISRDLYALLNSERSEQGGSVRRARFAQFFAVGLGGVIAYFRPMDNFDISIFVCGVFASSWLPVILLSLFWKRLNATAAFYGMLTGIGSLILLQALVSFRSLTLPYGVNQYIISTFLAILVSVLISLLHPAKSSNAENYYRIQNTLSSDMILRETRKSPEALAKLFRSYRLSRRIIWLTLFLSLFFWIGLTLMTYVLKC